MIAAEGMGEGETVGVEERALEAVAALAAVCGVPDQRVIDRAEVGADLVRAAGLEAGLDQGLAREQLDHGEVGPRLAGRGARDRHPMTLACRPPDRGVDRSRARRQPTAGEGEVAAL